MARSVGSLECTALPPGARKWVIGAAPRLSPHWTLQHRRHTAARLVLLFADDAEAHRAIGDWLDRTYPRDADDPPMKTYVERKIQDLHVSADADIATVVGTPELFAWVHEVVHNHVKDLAEEFAKVTQDLLLLPSLKPVVGQLALVRETAVGHDVTLRNPRSLRWPRPRQRAVR